MLTVQQMFVCCDRCGETLDVATSRGHTNQLDLLALLVVDQVLLCDGCTEAVEQERADQRRKRRVANYGTLRRRWLRLLIRRQFGLCGICVEPLPNDIGLVEVDHIVPVARMKEAKLTRRQLNHPNNLQATHSLCNKTKSASLPTDRQRRAPRPDPMF